MNSFSSRLCKLEINLYRGEFLTVEGIPGRKKKKKSLRTLGSPLDDFGGLKILKKMCVTGSSLFVSYIQHVSALIFNNAFLIEQNIADEKYCTVLYFYEQDSLVVKTVEMMWLLRGPEMACRRTVYWVEALSRFMLYDVDVGLRTTSWNKTERSAMGWFRSYSFTFCRL